MRVERRLQQVRIHVVRKLRVVLQQKLLELVDILQVIFLVEDLLDFVLLLFFQELLFLGLLGHLRDLGIQIREGRAELVMLL